MKYLLPLALVLGACIAEKKTSSDTAQYAAPPATDSVVDKIPPDTLVNEKGQKCVVFPQSKYDAIMLGESYPNCGWQ